MTETPAEHISGSCFFIIGGIFYPAAIFFENIPKKCRQAPTIMMTRGVYNSSKSADACSVFLLNCMQKEC